MFRGSSPDSIVNSWSCRYFVQALLFVELHEALNAEQKENQKNEGGPAAAPPRPPPPARRR